MSPSDQDQDANGGWSEAEAAAAEYALGVLDPQERAAAETRSERDPAFARAIFDWVLRLSALFDDVAPVDPPPQVWDRIQTALAARDAVLTAGAPSARPGFWRAWAAVSTAVAACALIFIAAHPGGGRGGLRAPFGAPSGGGTLVATLGLSESGSPALTVAYDPAQSTLYSAPDADFSIPRARAAELWLIPSDGKPRPLGLVDPAKPATMTMPAQYRALVRDHATLALSIEPDGGSKTGAPTGPVVASGKLAAV